MSFKQFFKKARYYSQYFPFTLHTVFYGVAVLVVYRVVVHKVPTNTDELLPTGFPFILLMAKIALLFFLLMVLLSLISTLACWLYFLWLRKKKGTQLSLRFDSETHTDKQTTLFLNAQLEGVFRPLLGFVKGKLFYDDWETTGMFSMMSGKRKEHSFWRAAITGKSAMQLSDIKAYELKAGFIYFQDMLHLLSLSVAQPIRGQFYQPPVATPFEEADISPKHTEQTDVRIEQMRRVEGDYLNYKDFESGDDVRRIVWKVYAKNRDWVVRIPEMFEPYASHVYLYASFHVAERTAWWEHNFFKEMLNYYKNKVWTVYEAFSKKEWELRYIPDQMITISESLTASEHTARLISHSNWQTTNPLIPYFNPKKGAVLCVSSFTDPHALQEVLERCDVTTVVYWVKCSNVFQQHAAWNIFKRLLFLPPDNRLNKVRTTWLFSPFRWVVQKREKALADIIKKSSVTVQVL